MVSPGSRVDLYAAIRRDARAGLSNRALQHKHGVGYRTVVAALGSAWPQPRKALPKRSSRLDGYVDVIDGWLRADLDAPRKQRHTAKRIFDRLLDEHDASELSYFIVREYVATRRRQIRVGAYNASPYGGANFQLSTGSTSKRTFYVSLTNDSNTQTLCQDSYYR